MAASAPLRQSTILDTLDRMPAPSATKTSRKRTITLVDGEELEVQKLDLSSVARPEVLEALKKRIIELEDALGRQVDKASQQGPEKPAKRAKTMAAAAAGDETGAGHSSTNTKAEEKKRNLQLKKIFDRLKKECKSDGVKFQGSPKTIKFDEVLETTEFEALFGGKGVLIQPRPDNKPGSTVTIIQFTTKSHIEALFGAELKALKGNRWSVGGVPTRRMGGGGLFGFGGGGSTFSKSVKQGACDVTIQSLDVNFSKNSMKCSLKFEVQQVGGGSLYGLDDDYY